MNPQAYTVAEFCKAYRLSRSALYDLWDSGEGPAYYKVGRRRFVSQEAAVKWQREREAATGNRS